MEALENKGSKSLPKARKPSNTTARHNRSNSDLENKNAKDALCSSQKACNQPKLPGRNSINPQLKSETKKGIQPSRSEAQNSLRKEILQLERHLKDQQVVRGALEKALGPDPAPVTLSHESPMLKIWWLQIQPANDLLREVATLELEIKHLELYLLALYRKAFDQQQQTPTMPPSDAHREAPKLSVSSRCSQMEETPNAKAPVRRGGDATLRYSCPSLSKRWKGGTVDDCSPSTCPRITMDSDHGLRSQSALSFRGVCSSRISPLEDSLARALRSCRSQPFSFLEVIV
ncbi:hypothetical protein GUJ93_ZPchr0013g37975 [Zizania palustris]|uniref:Ternary complex factor MIP1 leucine-zipper domain-containing protein n=1 Tax=Zizania palustris TaxID=103762 RepID=A0A8J6C6C8_ZIZPA|nr:hypothetical protein GUJ93_ZPchr0013g37975 [Zizania palustris]